MTPRALAIHNLHADEDRGLRALLRKEGDQNEDRGAMTRAAIPLEHYRLFYRDLDERPDRTLEGEPTDPKDDTVIVETAWRRVAGAWRARYWAAHMLIRGQVVATGPVTGERDGRFGANPDRDE